MNQYSLSKRLTMVADMTDKAECFADVGCDHGFLALYLLNFKRIEKAVCTDINEGPLERAKEHVLNSGFEDKVTFFLSDGLCSLPAEVIPDACAICGMGGLMGSNIIYDSDYRFRKMKYFILQLQSDLNLVRIFLDLYGYRIESEQVTFEEGKYYTSLKVVPFKEKKVIFESFEDAVSYIRDYSDNLSDEDAVDFFYPYCDKEDYECYKDFLYFMIDKYTSFINGMSETSNGYFEAARNLSIMKTAWKKYIDGGEQNEG